jgi:fructosamine-3-kinase
MLSRFSAIAEQISEATECVFTPLSCRPLAGGDINAAYCLQSEKKAYFVKLNSIQLAAMFAAEFAGLKELQNTNTLRVPTPIINGTTADNAYLVLEYINLHSANKTSDRLLGEQLARLHQLQQPYFGWRQDNTIGSTPQGNNKSSNWLQFWREKRLGFQLNLAAKNGYTGRLQANGTKLCDEMAVFFTSYQPTPALLHGDLWAGNVAVDEMGRPVIFDPACYYGDREADLAMTELFGGFSQDFYAAYQDYFPLDPEYRIRKNLYNLYHILNHLNLFGGGYLRQADDMIARLLAEIQ